MLVCRTVREIREFTNKARSEGKTVGLVPTMGYFHEGHLSLMREAKKRCDVVVISLFVNPLQFGPKEDLGVYPRDFDRDCAMAMSVGVDAVFAPGKDDMYPKGYNSFVEITGITDKLCGLSRPGHFRGVTTVVAKLFNIVRPNQAFFGQKDAQQALVIEKMVRDLNMDLEIVTLPIVREADGLAMSSRNVYLNEEQRQAAPVLYRSLCAFRDAVAKGERSVPKLRLGIEEMILSTLGAEIDYVEILSVPDLEPLDTINCKCIAALAVRFGKTRLIDNMVVEV